MDRQHGWIDQRSGWCFDHRGWICIRLWWMDLGIWMCHGNAVWIGPAIWVSVFSSFFYYFIFANDATLILIIQASLPSSTTSPLPSQLKWPTSRPIASSLMSLTVEMIPTLRAAILLAIFPYHRHLTD